MLAQVHREDEGVRLRVKGLEAGVSQRLGHDAVHECGKQALGIACQLLADGVVLDPCVLDCVVQTVDVLVAVLHVEVGVLAVQQFMQHKASVALEVSVGQDGIITHVGELDLTA